VSRHPWLGRRAVVRRLPSFGGTIGAIAFYSVSLTPSLLPRPWWLQAVVAGITATIGYVVGALIATAVRSFGLRASRRVVLVSWLAVIVLGLAAIVAVTVRSVAWQDGLRLLMDMDPHVLWWQWTLVPIVAFVLCAFFVVIGRLVRLGARAVARGLSRFVRPRYALAVAAALTVVIVVGLVQGFLIRGVLNIAESSASLANGGTSAGIVQPTLPTLSGGPQSLVTWSSLGAKGRDFVGQTPSRSEITAFTHAPAIDPIRVYVGLASASTLTQRADLAVAELERTGAFHRKALVVFATTGSGWVNENLAKPVEYMYGGDTALVAIQYSYLPSWISFLTEGEAGDAGIALFDAVHAHWSTLPPDARPKLMVSGESLGSYATEEAFGGRLTAVLARSNGAVLIGPTPQNPVWENVTNRRDPGSPVWRPIYRAGIAVRFAHRAADLASPAAPWNTPRVVHLENGSDPVTWWVPSLIWRKPAWLDGPRAPDVSNGMGWYPLVTFWQVTCDLAGATSVPDGFGHRFGTLPVAAWAAVTQPNGWSANDTERLETLLEVEGLRGQA
jgi:uncharacterized membrane protein